MDEGEIQMVPAPEGGHRLAVRHLPGRAPGVLWLGGFMSDMDGTKARALAAWGSQERRAVTLFDYSGHGRSEGAFTDGTISRWLAEARAVFDLFATGPTVLVGSSMGGWLALLLAQALRHEAPDRAAEQLAGMVLIAPAVDFTETLMWDTFSEEVKKRIEAEGVWHMPSAYGAPYPITRALIEDGRRHLMMGGAIEPGCPVHILQGGEDEDVPWSHALDLVTAIARDDVVFTLVKDGDHRLSRPSDVERLVAAVESVTDEHE